MNVKIYFPYYGYGNEDYEVSDQYMSEDDYINAIRKEDEMSRDVVYESMIRQSEGGSLIGSDVKLYSVGKEYNEKIEFCTCDGVLYNEEEEDMSVDELVTQMANQKAFCIKGITSFSFYKIFFIFF